MVPAVYGIVLVWSGGDVGDKEKNVVCLENQYAIKECVQQLGFALLNE